MARVDGRPHPVRPERYGTRRRPAPDVPTPPKIVPPVTHADVADHLRARHGFPLHVLNTATVTDLVSYHEAEHRFRTGEFLAHTHDPNAGQVLDPDEEIHQATLKAIREGRLAPALLEEYVERGEYAQTRRADGLPLSRYDQRCIEVCELVATRNARRARRARGAA